MENLIQIVRPLEISGFSPSFGTSGEYILISGKNLEDTYSLSFVDPLGNGTPAAFTTYFDNENLSYNLSGIIPNLHPSKGFYEISVENVANKSSFCCFYQPLSGGLAEGAKLHSKQFSDRISLNSIITPTGTNNSQGFEIKNITFTPVKPESFIRIDCELNLYSSSSAGAVAALYKDSEILPRKAWNQFLYDSSAGTVFKFSYVTLAGGTAPQTWRIRLGRTPNYSANIYLNRNSIYPTLYGPAALSSLSVTEFVT